MRDPFPYPPPEWLVAASQPYANFLNFPSLPLHVHEVAFAFVLYTFCYVVVSPALSRAVIPQRYRNFNRRTRVNWDVHVVSFVQSTVVTLMALYVVFYDEERKSIRGGNHWEARIWEYTGMAGLLQAFALGYFLWDFIICLVYVNIFGVGMLAHAISALSVFVFGYRPFVTFYAPVFLLYELSSPFLNIHWFCDKLDLTGSSLQAINGVLLTSTFFGCRLIWGTYNSVRVFADIFQVIRNGNTDILGLDFGAPLHFTARDLLFIANESELQRTAFAGSRHLPLWLAGVYLTANLTLNSLNVFWFGKMIQTIRKRFDPPWGTKGIGDDVVHWEPQEKAPKSKGSVKAAKARAEAALNEPLVADDGSKSAEVSGRRTTTAKTRRRA